MQIVNPPFSSGRFTALSGSLVVYIDQQDLALYSQLTTTSGDLLAFVQEQGYVTELRLTTTSGDIVAQIPSLTGYATELWANSTFIDTIEMTTISGDLIAQIPAGGISYEQLVTTSGDIILQMPSLGGYATETWVNETFPTIENLTTTSGDIVSQIGEGGVNLEQLTTTSGDIVLQIPSLAGYATESWVNLGFIVPAQLTTTSGDIVDQIPSLAGYATEGWANNTFIDNSEMTTISGDLVSQMGTGSVTEEQLTTTSGDIVSYIDERTTGSGVILVGSGTFTTDGTTITHNLNDVNHFNTVTPLLADNDQAALIGTIYTQTGSNTDTVFCTGQEYAAGIPFMWEVALPGSGIGSSITSSSPTIISGTQTTRPTAGTEGRLYLPTDGYYPAFDNGSVWVPQPQMGPSIVVMNPPDANTFIGYNVSTETTLVDDGDGLLLTQSGRNSSSDYLSGYLVALPTSGTPPYTLTVGIDVQTLFGQAAVATNAFIGICLTDGTNPATAKGYNFRLQYSSSGSFANLGGIIWAYGKINGSASGGTYSTALTVNPPLRVPGICFMRLRNDNVNIHCEASTDLRNWVTLYSKAKADYTTVTYGGLFVGQQTAAIPTTSIAAQAKYSHWELG
jgi:hypothetical protein